MVCIKSLPCPFIAAGVAVGAGRMCRAGCSTSGHHPPRRGPSCGFHFFKAHLQEECGGPAGAPTQAHSCPSLGLQAGPVPVSSPRSQQTQQEVEWWSQALPCAKQKWQHSSESPQGPGALIKPKSQEGTAQTAQAGAGMVGRAQGCCRTA